MSWGSMVIWLVRRAHRSAAAPCSHTPHSAASKAGSPWASSAASIPASTSPLPPRASPGLPVGFCTSRPSGAATSVPAPLSTATQPNRRAQRRAAAGRSACTAATVVSSSRAISPGWGVSRVSGGRQGAAPSSPAARAFRASASSTAPRQGAPGPSSAASTWPAVGPSPGPASSTAGDSAKRRRTAAASAARMPPSGSVRQGRAQHSGVRASVSAITGSTPARYTSPAPVRSAPSQHSAAAPR